MKYIDTVTNDDETTVAPLVGAWIEISLVNGGNYYQPHVAPLVGAWIEIISQTPVKFSSMVSLLSWERGLKYGKSVEKLFVYEVAPLVGAWIEISNTTITTVLVCRSSRGSVD